MARNKSTLALITAFLVALTGAIPTITEGVKSLQLGVGFGSSRDAEVQLSAWKRNFECASGNIQTIKNPFGVEIGSVVCPSGDVLIMGKGAGAHSYAYRWVEFSTVLEAALAVQLVPSAAAGGTSWTDADTMIASLLCQKWVDAYHILRKVADNDGCYDVLIYAPTGAILSSTPSSCSCEWF